MLNKPDEASRMQNFVFKLQCGHQIMNADCFCSGRTCRAPPPAKERCNHCSKYDDLGPSAGQPLLERHDEEEGTSAGLDGEAPRQQPAMSAGAFRSGSVSFLAILGMECCLEPDSWGCKPAQRLPGMVALAAAVYAALDGTSRSVRLALRRRRALWSAGASKGAAMQDYEPVSYNYSWFHFIFSLASMYIAMLMTGAFTPDTSSLACGTLSCHDVACSFILVCLDMFSNHS